MSIERRWLSAHIITDMPDEDVIQNVKDSLTNFVDEALENGMHVDWDSLRFYCESPVIVTDAAGNETAYSRPMIMNVEAVKPA